MYFVKDNNVSVREEHKCSMTEAATKLGALWTAMTDAEKKPY